MKVYAGIDDAQCRPPTGTCMRCGSELWGQEADPDEYGCVYCPECYEEMEEAMKYDSDTVQAVMEAYDSILAKYLSEELRNVESLLILAGKVETLPLTKGRRV